MRYLREQEKERSRKLWELVFEEDSAAFLDYYYTEKTKDNAILVQEENGEIISMLHRNPFRMNLNGMHIPTEYLVAVATREDCRKRGHMRRLLTRCLNDAGKEKIPFQFLMPAAEAIYTPYGFRSITQRCKETQLWWKNLGLTETEASAEEYAELASFVNVCLSAQSDLYVHRDAQYFARLHAERRSDGGCVRVLKSADGSLCGYYSGYCGGKPEITEAVFLPQLEKQYMPQEKEKEPHLMARITCLLAFLRHFSIPQEQLGACTAGAGPAVYLDVADTIVPENHGHFLWCFRENGSHLIPLDEERRALLQEADGKKKKAVCADIADLGSWLFGYRPLRELVDSGLVVGPEESIEVLRQVRTLKNIRIRDEV